MFCSKCGAQSADGVKFCGKCGAPLGDSAPAQSSVPAAAPAGAQGGASGGAKPSMLDYYVGVWKKYLVHEGRASRAEYWYFVLCNMLAAIGLSIVDSMLFNGMTRMQDGSGPLSGLYSLAVCIPSIMVGIRRLHDSNHRGSWLLFPIVNLIFLIIDGDAGPNRFGPDPKGRTAQAA